MLERWRAISLTAFLRFDSDFPLKLRLWILSRHCVLTYIQGTSWSIQQNELFISYINRCSSDGIIRHSKADSIEGSRRLMRSHA
jgi:hypothetical protein